MTLLRLRSILRSCNFVYLERALRHLLRAHGFSVPDDLLPHVRPSAGHLALTGDYVWAGTEIGRVRCPARYFSRANASTARRPCSASDSKRAAKSSGIGTMTFMMEGYMALPRVHYAR